MDIGIFATVLESVNFVALVAGAAISLHVVFKRGRNAIQRNLKFGILIFWICEIFALGPRLINNYELWPTIVASGYYRVAVENLAHAAGIVVLTYVVLQLMPQINDLRAAAERLHKNEKALEKRQAYETHLNRELDEIYRLLAKGDPDFTKQALKITSKALDIGRVGVSISADDPDILVGVLRYECLSDTFVPGGVFNRKDHPTFRAYLKEHKVIASECAMEDPRVAELRDDWLAPNGVKSACFVNLEISEHEAGSVYAETIERNHNWILAEILFLRSVGDAVLLNLAQQRIREQTQALDKSRAEFDAVANFTLYWDTLLNPDGTVRWCNPAVQRVCGYDVDEIVGRDDFPLFLAGNDDQRAALQRVRDRILDGEQSSQEPVQFTAKNGEKEWFIMDWQEVSTKDQLISGFLVSTILATKRVEAEESLKRAEKVQRELDSYVHTFHDNAPTAVIVTHMNREIASWNASAERIFGYTSSEVIGRKVDILFPTETEESQTAFYDAIALKQSHQEQKFENARKDGTPVFCSWNDAVINDDEGNPIAVFSIASDITDMVDHQRNLENERQRFEDFSTAASDFFWETDADGNLSHLSKRFFDLAEGMSESEVIGKPFSHLAPDDFADASWRAAVAAIRQYEPFRGAMVTRRMANGDYLRVSLNGVPIHREDGTFEGYRGSGTDMDETMRQSSVEKLIGLNVRGLVGADYFSALVKGIYDYLQSDWVLVGELAPGPEQRIQVLAGYGPDGELVPFSYELAGTPCEFADGDDNICLHASGVANRFPDDTILAWRGIEGYAGIRLLDDSGNLAGVLITLSTRPLEDPALMRRALEIFGARATAELSRSRSEAANESLQTQLMHAQRMETMGALAGGIAHDFNNILTPIMGYSEILVESLDAETDEQRDAAAILNGAKRARTLIKQILDFSRRKETSQNVAFDVSPIVKGTAAFVGASIPSGVAIETRVDGDLAKVKGDPSKLDQVLMNLITNAWHSLGDDSGRIDIDVANKFVDAQRQDVTPSLEVGSYICISVTDTGCGIPEDLHEKIFEPFFTTKGSGSGTGFGLSTTKGIVEAMGGSLHLESTLGEGSTFSIYLPATNDDRFCHEEPSLSGRSAFAMASRLQSNSLHIMYVDDEPENTKVAARMLEATGHVVSTFERPSDALEAIEADPFSVDLIITDDSMPQMAGSEMCRQVLATIPDLPVIVVTGGSLKQLRARYAPLGITEYVSKPFGIREITDSIQVATKNSVNKILERF